MAVRRKYIDVIIRKTINGLHIKEKVEIDTMMFAGKTLYLVKESKILTHFLCKNEDIKSSAESVFNRSPKETILLTLDDHSRVTECRPIKISSISKDTMFFSAASNVKKGASKMLKAFKKMKWR